jgi:peptidoglycan DL-endopeptidase LytE
MHKRPGFFALLFFVLLFVVAQADPALARKSGSTNSAHKTTKKHSVKMTRKANTKTTRAKEPARSATRLSQGKKAHLAKNEKGRAKTTESVGTQSTEATIDENNDDEYIRYRMKQGETLDKVAERFNIAKEEIVDLNQFQKRRLKPGSVVLIPKTDDGSDEEPVVLNDRPLSPWKNEEERGILVKVAKSFAGAPYKYGGDTVRGLDCSAFVRKMYQIFEVQLPRSAREQYCAGPRVAKEDLLTGDLVFFRTRAFAKYPTHVGIYIGDDKFIHSSSAVSGGVKVDCLSDGYYSRTFTGAVRVKSPPATNRTQTEQGTDRGSGNS